MSFAPERWLRRWLDAPFRTTVWLLPVAATLHNLEEWIWQPAWSPEGFSPPVGAFEFRFAVAVVTAGFWIVAFRAARREPTPLAVHAAVAAAGILLLNVAFPHVLATLWFRSYAPGVVTAVLVNAWAAPLVLRAALRSGGVTPRGACTATAIACLLLPPALVLVFWLAGVLEPTLGKQG